MFCMTYLVEQFFYKNRKAAAVLLNSYWNVSDILSNLQSIKRFERNSQVI